MTAIAVHDVPAFHGAISRFLTDRERRFPIGPDQLPLVIEREPSSGDDLRTFLAAHSSVVKEAIYQYAAVLLRGFKVPSAQEFERAISNIEGLRPMTGYFMAEAGREHADGAAGVFHTNTNYKTGGSFFLGGFHSENYYSPDVPGFQSFWCKREPTLGGETALVHMTSAYAELDGELQERLEREPACAAHWRLSDIATRYGLSEGCIETFCESAGLQIALVHGEKRALLYKPSVFRHPRTGRRSLQVNLSLELPGLDRVLQTLAVPYYSGARWALHRLGWRHPVTWTVLYCLHHLPGALRRPSVLVKPADGALRRLYAVLTGGHRKHGREPQRIGDWVAPDDMENIARAIWKHCTVFSWQRDDVLVFDNLQVLHAGMPGFGARELRVIMCNPIPLRYPAGSGLVEVPAQDEAHEAVDDRLRRFARSHAA